MPTSGRFLPQFVGLDQHVDWQFQTIRQLADHSQREGAGSVENVRHAATGARRSYKTEVKQMNKLNEKDRMNNRKFERFGEIRNVGEKNAARKGDLQ